MEVSEIFAERAKARLRELGWTHEDLANQLGVQRGTASKYLQGKTAPGADLLLAWADALKVRPEWLLGREQPLKAMVPGDPRLTAIRFLAADATDAQVTVVMALIKPFLERLNKNQSTPKTG